MRCKPVVVGVAMVQSVVLGCYVMLVARRPVAVYTIICLNIVTSLFSFTLTANLVGQANADWRYWACGSFRYEGTVIGFSVVQCYALAIGKRRLG